MAEAMSVDEMRAQMARVLGTTPIPDDALARHAALVASLGAAIDAAARDLAPEDEPGGYAAHLDRLAGEDDDR
jgi:hypothetical protein